MRTKGWMAAGAAMAALTGLLAARQAGAHCDTVDGPVALAARRALTTGNVNHALIWVQPGGESAIRNAFKTALAARKRAPGRAAAERRFLETLVKVHRHGEGADYTGVKPAGSPVEPGIAAADRALAGGSPEAALRLLRAEVERGFHRRYADVRRLSRFAPNDVPAGRKYVAAYVDYIHYVEGVREMAQGGSGAHHKEGAKAARHASER